jgi:hypothetical protein
MTTFIYTGEIYDRPREVVAENIVRIMSELIQLPKGIEIEFRTLAESIYGETLLDSRFKKRIRLHDRLTAREIIVPLIHELLHLNQVHTGKLLGRRDGSFIWNGKVYHASKTITVKEWSQLPWEIDVAEKEKHYLTEVLNKS